MTIGIYVAAAFMALLMTYGDNLSVWIRIVISVFVICNFGYAYYHECQLKDEISCLKDNLKKLEGAKNENDI